MRTLRSPRRTLWALLLVLPGLAVADAAPGEGRANFIGVFYPVITAAAIDPSRCPDASHPLLLSFSGLAYTTLGAATFTQSHCQDLAQSSFERGRKHIVLANGDELTGVYRGRLLPTVTTATDGRVVIDAAWRNTGGTGALLRAHGAGKSAGIVDAATGNAVVTGSGTL